LTERDERGRPRGDSTFLILFSAHEHDIEFTLPVDARGSRWQVVVDTAHDDAVEPTRTVDAGAAYPLRGRSLVLLEQQDAGT
jgi:glycogen operon protein